MTLSALQSLMAYPYQRGLDSTVLVERPVGIPVFAALTHISYALFMQCICFSKICELLLEFLFLKVKPLSRSAY
jgi:hypothetical protein